MTLQLLAHSSTVRDRQPRDGRTVELDRRASLEPW